MLKYTRLVSLHLIFLDLIALVVTYQLIMTKLHRAFENINASKLEDTGYNITITIFNKIFNSSN